MKTYIPRADSLAQKVVDHLKDHGGRLTPMQIAELFSVARASVSNLLTGPVKYGWLTKQGSGRGIAYTRADTDAAPATAPPSAKTKKQRQGAQPRTHHVTPPPERLPSCAALYSDGDVALLDVQQCHDGTSCTLTDAQAREVHRFLARIYGPHE